MSENDKIPVPEGVEITEHVVTKGQVEVLTKGALTNPPPAKMSRIIEALVYFCAGLLGVVSGTDLFTGYQAKVIGFILSVVMLALGGLKIIVGVNPEEKK